MYACGARTGRQDCADPHPCTCRKLCRSEYPCLKRVSCSTMPTSSRLPATSSPRNRSRTKRREPPQNLMTALQTALPPLLSPAACGKGARQTTMAALPQHLPRSPRTLTPTAPTAGPLSHLDDDGDICDCNGDRPCPKALGALRNIIPHGRPRQSCHVTRQNSCHVTR